MKKCIRYLYEYQDGNRVQNVGFVKLEESERSVSVQIYGKGFPASDRQELEVFLFYVREENGEKQCIGIPWGQMHVSHPMTSCRVEYNKKEYDEVEGIILRMNVKDKMKWYVASWDGQIVAAEQMVLVENPNELQEEKQQIEEPRREESQIEESQELEIPEANVQVEAQNPVYKITRKDLVNLPRQEWKIANNQFLVHGCRNFHHLVSFEKEGKCWLGVPGIYHEKEAHAAKAFGFEQFMKPDEGEIHLTEDERQDEEEFGYWCRQVHNIIKR